MYIQVMKSVTVNISFQDDLLKKIDDLAGEESRSRSELIREAARMYIERKNRWKSIFRVSEKARKKTGLTQEDISAEIKAVRTSRSRKIRA